MRARALAVFLISSSCAASTPGAPKDSTQPTVITVEAAPDAATGPAIVSTPEDAGIDAGEAKAAADHDPCRGKSFELGALPKACRTNEAPHVPHYLTAKLVADESATIAGDEVGVTLTITNPSNAPALLVITTGCEDLEVQAFKGNARADFVNTTCGFGKGCGTATYRIELESHGELTKHFRYRARVKKVGKDCRVTESPLAPGPYVLHLESSADFVFHDRLAKLRAALFVTR